MMKKTMICMVLTFTLFLIGCHNDDIQNHSSEQSNILETHPTEVKSDFIEETSTQETATQETATQETATEATESTEMSTQANESATQERITADPPPSQSFDIRSLEELNRMREMAECKDEAQLEEYVQSIKASGIMSKDDLLAFVKIIDSLSHVSLLDGKVTWICFSRDISEDTGKETAIVYITTESANGDWTRIEYLLSVKDASKKIADEIAFLGEDAALAAPVKTADERLTLHAETRKAHPSGTGTMILWYGEADGIFTRIHYYTNTPENIDANELFGSLQTTKALQ